MSWKKKTTIFICLSILSCLLGSSLALAQASSFKISPVRVEDIVEPGDMIERSIKVTNASAEPATLYPYLRDFVASGESGRPELKPAGSEIYGASQWINIPQQGIELEAGEEKEISFLIEVPQEAGPGGYYGAVMFGSLPPDFKLGPGQEERGAAITIGQQTGALVLLKVLGDIQEEAVIREFSTDNDLYKTPFSVKFLTRVENRGNVHIKPYGNIKITNILGDEVAVLTVNEGGSNVLADSIRRFENSWSDNLAFGKYTASLVLSFGTFASEGGQGRQTLSAQNSFWIIPWNIVIPVLLGIVFVTSLFLLFLQTYKNKAVEKALQKAGVGEVRYIKKYEGPSPVLRLALLVILVVGIILLVGGVVFFLFFA